MGPKEFKAHGGDRRSWQGGIVDYFYFDSTNLGLRELLNYIELMIADVARLPRYRASSEGLEVVGGGRSPDSASSIKPQDGDRACQKLHACRASLASRQGMVLAGLGGMVAIPAKIPGDSCLVDRVGREDQCHRGRDATPSPGSIHRCTMGPEPDTTT